MKIAQSERSLAYPHSWGQLAHGEWLNQQIQAHVDEWSHRLFGYHLLKLGGLSCELKTRCCNIQHQVSIDKFNSLRNIEADAYQLPFIAKSFDACILANQLEFMDDPHRLLREVDRVMADDGHLIISGLNPNSLMGLGGLLPWKKETFPWNARMFIPKRVIDWLSLLNYQLMEVSMFGLFPSAANKTYLLGIESLCSSLLPVFGSVYFIVARKRTYPLNKIKLAWKEKNIFISRHLKVSN